MVDELSNTQSQVLSVEGIGVTLDGRPVLEDISFAIRSGEFTGMIGSNGSGKTTLLRTILGLQRPTDGRILILGQPQSARQNRLIGYVPQKVMLDPDMPIRARDLIALGLDGHRFGVPLRSKQRTKAVDEVINAVDAFEFADARVGRLSGGEQQRVMIAHTLISRPRLLLLDEPLANLDLRSSQEIVELLGRISSEDQVSVLISAHDINPLLSEMDRVVYLAGGRAVNGTTEEVIRSDVLTELYQHSVDVLHLADRIVVISGHEDAHHDGRSDDWPFGKG